MKMRSVVDLLIDLQCYRVRDFLYPSRIYCTKKLLMSYPEKQEIQDSTW